MHIPKLHATSDINGYIEYVKKNSKYNVAHNTNGQHYPQQCSSDRLNFYSCMNCSKEEERKLCGGEICKVTQCSTTRVGERVRVV